jgi:hypothetical protein
MTVKNGLRAMATPTLWGGWEGQTINKSRLRALEKSSFGAFKDKIIQIIIFLIKKTIFATL